MNSKRLEELLAMDAELVESGVSGNSTGGEFAAGYVSRQTTVQTAEANSGEEPDSTGGVLAGEAADNAITGVTGEAVVTALSFGTFSLNLGDLNTVITEDVTAPFVGGATFSDPAEEVPEVDSISVTGGGSEGTPVSIINSFIGGSVVTYDGGLTYPDRTPLAVIGDIVIDLSDVTFTGTAGQMVMGGKVTGNGGDGMAVGGKIDVTLTNVDGGGNDLVFGFVVENGGTFTVGNGIVANLDNYTSAWRGSGWNWTVSNVIGVLENEFSNYTVNGGIALNISNSTVQDIYGIYLNDSTQQGRAAANNKVTKAADSDYAVEINLENTSFNRLVAISGGVTLDGGIKISVDAASRAVNRDGNQYNTLIAAVAPGAGSVGLVVVNGDIDFSVYDDSCEALYTGMFWGTENDGMIVNGNVNITVKSSGIDHSEGAGYYSGVLSIYGGIQGVVYNNNDPENPIYNAEVAGKITLNLEGLNINNVVVGGRHSVGSALSAGAALETVITGELIVYGSFNGGIESSESPITVNGDVKVGVADGFSSTITFKNGYSFSGAFNGDTSSGVTINGGVYVDLVNTMFERITFSGIGTTYSNYSEGTEKLYVANGAHVSLKNTVFENQASDGMYYVMGIRTAGGKVEIHGGVTGVLDNVTVRSEEDFYVPDPEFPLPDDYIFVEDSLVGGAVAERGDSKTEIFGTVDLAITNSAIKILYGGGYSRESLGGGGIPVDNYRRSYQGAVDDGFYKTITVSHDGSSTVAVDLDIKNTSFTSMFGGGRNIEVIGDVVISLDNASSGEVVYGSGIGVWQDGDVYINIDGNCNITDRLVGGGGGTEEIMKQVFDEHGDPVHDEQGNPVYESSGYWVAELDGNVNITLSGNSTFNTVYGGSDFVGYGSGENEPVPTFSTMSSADPGPGQTATIGRPTEITGFIKVNLANVTIKNYVGAGLGTVGSALFAGSTAVQTLFTQATTVSDSFIGGSHYYHYIQGSPVIYGDILVGGGVAAGTALTFGGEFCVGSKVEYSEITVENGYWASVWEDTADYYEYVYTNDGDYTYSGSTAKYYPDPVNGNYRYDEETGGYVYDYENGTHVEFWIEEYEYTPGTGSYNLVSGGGGYVIKWHDPVIGKTDVHTVKGSVVGDLNNVTFTGSNLILVGGGSVISADPEQSEQVVGYLVEGGTDIKLTNANFGSNVYVGGLKAVDGAYGQIVGTVNNTITNAAFGATTLSEPALILGAYATGSAKAELSGIDSTLEGVDLRNRANSVIYGGNVVATGGNADLTGDILLTIKSGYYNVVYGGSASLDGTGSAEVNGNITLNITGGNFAGNIVAGSSNAVVNGDITANIGGISASAAWIIGGSLNQVVNGDIDLTLSGTFGYIVFGGGSGAAAGVTGTISVTVTGQSGRFNAMIYAGGNGDIGSEGDTGTRISVTVNSTQHGEAYHLFLGTSSNASAPGNSTIYGNIVLEYLNNGVTDTETVTGQIYCGSRRTNVAGDSTITGKALLYFGAATINNQIFGGGYATSSSGQTVRVITEGGVEITLDGLTCSKAALIGGGQATGDNAYSIIGTEENRAGISILVTGSTTASAIHGGGYATGKGKSIVYGDSVLTVDSVNVETDLIHGGGYANAATEVVYGKAIINILASADTNYIHGGGYALGWGISAVVGGVEINISDFEQRAGKDMVIYAGGRNAKNGVAYVGADAAGTENLSSIGTNVTIDADTTVWHIYGGGYSEGAGHTTVYGGTHITINGGTVAGSGDVAGYIYGGGHVYEKSGNYSIVNGGTNITINGGTVGNVYGGGSTYYADAATNLSIVNGGTYIKLNSSENAIKVNNYICGGGNRGATVNGGTKIEFTGLGSNLTFTSYVIGSNASNKNTYGVKELLFTSFTGDFNGRIANFDTVTISDSSVNWAVSQSLSSVSEWNFQLDSADAALTWENGTNSFDGDTLNLMFDSSYNGGIILAGSDTTLTDWDKFSTVNIGGSSAAWNGSSWLVADEWELKRDSSNNLILSKLA